VNNGRLLEHRIKPTGQCFIKSSLQFYVDRGRRISPVAKPDVCWHLPDGVMSTPVSHCSSDRLDDMVYISDCPWVFGQLPQESVEIHKCRG
jgi:hypothetical protein